MFAVGERVYAVGKDRPDGPSRAYHASVTRARREQGPAEGGAEARQTKRQAKRGRSKTAKPRCWEYCVHYRGFHAK